MNKHDDPARQCSDPKTISQLACFSVCSVCRAVTNTNTPNPNPPFISLKSSSAPLFGLPAFNGALNIGMCFDAFQSVPKHMGIQCARGRSLAMGNCKVWMPANRQQHWSHFLPHVFTAANISITVCGMTCFYPEDGVQNSPRNFGNYLQNCIKIHVDLFALFCVLICRVCYAWLLRLGADLPSRSGFETRPDRAGFLLDTVDSYFGVPLSESFPRRHTAAVYFGAFDSCLRVPKDRPCVAEGPRATLMP